MTQRPFHLITLDTQGNTLLEQVLTAINQHPEIPTLWKILNVNAIQRLGMTDHGVMHFQIVAESALKMLRLLMAGKVKPSIVEDYKLKKEYAEVVVVLAALLHDLGMSIHRSGHEEFSVVMVNTLLREMLDFIPQPERTIVISETLHAIISHRRDGRPLTIEAGIVRVADALDMTKGRSRIPYEAGKIDIHSVSAQAIDQIKIAAGKTKIVDIQVIMNHTAGIFQVDELLQQKVIKSGIEQYLDIKVYIDKGQGPVLFKDFYFK